MPAEDKAAYRLIRKHHPHLLKARVVCVGKPKASRAGRVVNIAKARRASRLVQALVRPVPNYVIEIGRDVWETLTTRERGIVLDHELMHFAGYDEKRKWWRMRRHDVEEFYEILQRYGAWSEELKALVKLTRSVRERREES